MARVLRSQQAPSITTLNMKRNLESPKRRQSILSLAALSAVSAAAGIWPGLVMANDLKLGAPAPPLVLHTLDGRTIATKDLIGQVVIATFWATWCEPCEKELPLLSDYAAKHAEDGLQILGFSLDEASDLADVKTVAAKLRFPVGLLGSQYAGGYGRIWHLPVSFVIDRAGRLADNGWDAPEPSLTSERLARIVDPMLLHPKAKAGTS